MRTGNAKATVVRRPAVIEDGTVIEGVEFSRLLTKRTKAERETVPLSHGRELHLSPAPDGDRLTVSSSDGTVELDVLLTEKGPLLRFRSAELHMTATRDIRMQCDDFRVDARGKAVIAAGDDLVAAGKTCELRATRGEARIKANDDVRVKGERIRLNC